MRAEIDHLVWAGPDLDSLVAHVADVTGVQPSYGGRHEGRGTHNYLLGLGGSRYLELLGPDPGQPEPADPRPMRVDELTRPRLVGWAIRTNDLDALLATARSQGYDPGDAAGMSRRTSDGRLLSWRLTPPEGGFDGVVPFAIDWLASRHPAADLPSVELATMTLHHPEPDRITHALTALGATHTVNVAAAELPGISASLANPRGVVHIP